MSREHRIRHDDTRPLSRLSRRGFLKATAAATGLLIAPSPAVWARHNHRALSMRNLHTGEKITRTYWIEGKYLAEPLADIAHVLRDHRNDEVHPIDPHVLDILHRLQHKLGSHQPFEIISGYRSPITNAMLRNRSGGVAKKSLHMRGRAIDVRLPGRDLAKLRQAALSLKAGGVGYYPKSNFLHLDTGRVRQWS